MKYYGWAGWEEHERGKGKELTFMISPVRKVKRESEYHRGYLIVDIDKATYTNAPRLLSGADYDTEVQEELVFDTLEEARKEVVMRLFT